MTNVIAVLMLLLGAGLAVTSYFFLAAPLGPPISSIYSSPRLVGAPALFVLGIILIFASAVAYELIPSRAQTPSRVEKRATTRVEME